MKPYLSIAAAALFTLSSTHLALAQGVDMVRIEVKVDTDTDRTKKEGKGSGGATINQGKTLNISLSGHPKNPETRTGLWTVWGRPAGKGNDLEVIDSGEIKLELPPTGAQVVETKEVNAKYTQATAAKGSKNKPGKKVEATGTKYSGYSVVVKEGDKVVGEAYDPVSLKNEIEKKK